MEGLLARLDDDEEVQRDGGSAVLRRAADLYLRRRRARRIAEAYRQAYAGGAGLGEAFEGWLREGVWPDKWSTWPYRSSSSVNGTRQGSRRS